MSQLTTYRAKGHAIGLVFLFKYDLNGHLRGFKIEEGELNQEQKRWMFSGSNFPVSETMMQQVWMKDPRYKKLFDVQVNKADVSFESFWSIWGLKIKKEKSEAAWNKLTEAEKIQCFLSHAKYEAHLKKTGQAKAHLVTWINQKRWTDEY
ncbi:MAG TPA: hypothetical protein VKZ97_10895 [Flavobacteriaceae bacterium]|nr:hypothetical protein [Flavobacteriaceae bacterium]